MLPLLIGKINQTIYKLCI